MPNIHFIKIKAQVLLACPGAYLGEGTLGHVPPHRSARAAVAPVGALDGSKAPSIHEGADNQQIISITPSLGRSSEGAIDP